MHDPAINFFHGQRDYLRTDARDRALSAGSRKLGNHGASALKNKPDLNRIGQGFFEKAGDPVTKYRPSRLVGSRGRYLDDSGEGEFLLQRNFRDREREDYFRRREAGLTNENYIQ